MNDAMKAIYLFILLAVLAVGLFGCYSEGSTRRASDIDEMRGVTNLHQAVCRTSKVFCSGSQVKVRGETPVFYIWERGTTTYWGDHPSTLYQLSLSDVRRIVVLTDPTERAMFSRAGRKAVVLLHMKS